jgi:hypothetical protein
MPRGDRTGPQGQGPMTGRGRGKCNPNGNAFAPRERGNMGSGRKAGRKRGQGSSRRAGRGQAKGLSRRS